MLASHLLTATKTNLAALELTRHLGVNYKTARRLFNCEMLPRLATAIMRCKPCPEPSLRAASNLHA